MKLRDYIKERQVPIEDAAKGIGITPGYLYELIAERMVPGRKTAQEIVKWSGGMVKFADLWPDDPND